MTAQITISPLATDRATALRAAVGGKPGGLSGAGRYDSGEIWWRVATNGDATIQIARWGLYEGSLQAGHFPVFVAELTGHDSVTVTSHPTHRGEIGTVAELTLLARVLARVPTGREPVDDDEA